MLSERIELLRKIITVCWAHGLNVGEILHMVSSYGFKPEGVVVKLITMYVSKFTDGFNEFLVDNPGASPEQYLEVDQERRSAS